MAKPRVNGAVQLNYYSAVSSKKPTVANTAPSSQATKETILKKSKPVAKPSLTQAEAKPLPVSDIQYAADLSHDELAGIIRLKSQRSANTQPIPTSNKQPTAAASKQSIPIANKQPKKGTINRACQQTNNQTTKQITKQTTKQTKSTKVAKQKIQSNDITISKQSADISWSPEVPPGHTRYSWEIQKKKSMPISIKNPQKEKSLVLSANQVMNKFKVNEQETKQEMKHQAKTAQSCSKYLIAKNGYLRWNKKEEKELTKEEAEKVCKIVEYSIMNQVNNNIPRITQGVHDRYVMFCVKHKKKIFCVDDFQWHKSKYLQIESGVLKLNTPMWTEEKIESIGYLAENDALEFAEEVEYCIFERFPVSKEVDSMYLEYCAAQNRQEIAHYTGQEAYEHGYRLLHGIMVPIDKQMAVHYIQQAVDFDQCTAAHSLLGYCYQFGDGLRIDVERSIEHYQIAVAGGDDFGKIRLGRCYLAGIGVPKNIKKAHELFEDGMNGLRSIADSKRADSNRALCLLHTQPAAH